MAKSKEFKVITWSFNNDHLEWYDVIPYFVREYQSEKPTDRPETFDDFKEFIKRRGMYMFWARCEWETIITGWPAQKRINWMYGHKLNRISISLLKS